MTTYYVGTGGDNGNNGTSWATRKLTLNGVEDIPVAGDDIVYVGAGTYRELLTCDVSGTSGHTISYIGDYTGANTDGTGGLVRITGSDNDQTATRASAINGNSKNFRTFQGFLIDITSSYAITGGTAGTNWTIDKCAFVYPASYAIYVGGANQLAWAITNCYFFTGKSVGGITYTHTADVDNTGHTVNNCIFNCGYDAVSVRTDNVGGITVKNSVLLNSGTGVYVGTALAVGQTMTVYNCIFSQMYYALRATTVDEFVEDYNAIFGTNTARTNVNTGAHSNAYPPLFDMRWFMQMVHEGAGPNSITQLITPFDLSSYCDIVELAGTSPTTTDMRGTAVQGTQREWGALEYDSTLKYEGSAAVAGGGGLQILQGSVVS
jgi:hypothetical protein